MVYNTYMKRRLLFFYGILLIILAPFSSWAATFERDLFYGILNDPDVTRLQEFLNNEGVYSGPVTGNFLSLTRIGVKKFQEREGVSPALGYFGPKTRLRVNTLISTVPQAPVSGNDREDSIAKITAQIKALQDQLKVLQAEASLKQAEIPALPSPDLAPPYFSKNPMVSEKVFIENPPLGAHYPYRVRFDWLRGKTDFTESLYCNPSLQSVNGAEPKTASYFPEPRTSYSCEVTLKNSAGKEAKESVSFVAPTWLSIEGRATSTFPAVETNPFKIGEFVVYNGLSASALFIDLETILYDEMDSIANRNQRVNFLIREGTSATDTLVSKTEFTFLLTVPKVGEPHRLVLKLPFDVTIRVGGEKRYSIWVESMKYVRSGLFRIATTKVNVTSGEGVVGGVNVTLTKEPPL